MRDPWMWVVAILAVGIAYVLLPWMRHVYGRYRAARAVLCPEERARAWVEIDAAHAAWTAAVGWPRLRVKDCSLWAKRGACTRACLRPSGERAA